MRRIVLIAVAWLIGAALTATAATAAVNALGAGLLGPSNRPLSAAEVQRQLDESPPGSSEPASAEPSSPGTSASTSPLPAVAQKPFSTGGGSVIVQCSAGKVSLSANPAQGYAIDDFVGGPAAQASVKFKGSSTEISVIATCPGGQPHIDTTAEDRHGGGNGGGKGK